MGMLGHLILWVDPNVLKACSGVLSDAIMLIVYEVIVRCL